MAITVNLGPSIIDLTISKGTITDSSTYTSPSRSAVGVFVKVYKVASDGVKSDLLAIGNTSDPNTDSIWTYNYTEDGWIQINYVAAPDYAGGTSYVKYDSVFDPSTKLVYRSKTNANLGNALSNINFWELITSPADLVDNVGTTTESINLTTITSIKRGFDIIYPYIRKGYGTITGDAFLEASTTYRRTQDVRLYELLGTGVAAIEIAIARQEYSLGEIFCRRATDLIDNANL